MIPFLFCWIHALIHSVNYHEVICGDFPPKGEVEQADVQNVQIGPNKAGFFFFVCVCLGRWFFLHDSITAVLKWIWNSK